MKDAEILKTPEIFLSFAMPSCMSLFCDCFSRQFFLNMCPFGFAKFCPLYVVALSSMG